MTSPTASTCPRGRLQFTTTKIVARLLLLAYLIGPIFGQIGPTDIITWVPGDWTRGTTISTTAMTKCPVVPPASNTTSSTWEGVALTLLAGIAAIVILLAVRHARRRMRARRTESQLELLGRENNGFQMSEV